MTAYPRTVHSDGIVTIPGTWGQYAANGRASYSPRTDPPHRQGGRRNHFEAPTPLNRPLTTLHRRESCRRITACEKPNRSNRGGSKRISAQYP